MSYDYADSEVDRAVISGLRAEKNALQIALKAALIVVQSEEREWSRHSYRYLEGTKNPYTATVNLICKALNIPTAPEPELPAARPMGQS